MKTKFKKAALWIASLSLAGLVGCGGGGSSGDQSQQPVNPNPPVAVATTNVETIVIDGAIHNATVCMDKNSNGLCDPGETQGQTNAAGKITLPIPNADVGKFPMLAVVGIGAVDVDNGTVTVPYRMLAPAGRPAVISPLTTMVQTGVAAGLSVLEAEATIKEATGIKASLFADFTAVAAPTDGSPDPKVVARMAVVATQAQLTSLASTVGTTAIDNAVITQAALNGAINQRLLQILPALVAALSDPTIAALSTTAKEAAVVAALSGSLLGTSSVPTLVAINNQNVVNASAGTATSTVTAAPPTAGFIQLATLNFTNATNWFSRLFTGSLAQNTPDASGNNRFVDRKYRSNNGAVAQWNFGNNPQDQNLHWTGSAWEACQVNFESTSTLRDAAGNNTSNYCNNYNTTRSNRVTFDIAGKSMSQVYDQIRAGGYTNLTIANSGIVLGSATFPAGSQVFYQTSTPLTQSQAYGPGINSQIFNYSAAVAAGGDARLQAAGVGCNSAEFRVAPAIQATTLDSMVAAYRGIPCTFGGPDSFVSNGVTYTSPDALNEVWGGTTLNIGTLGTVGGAPTAYYTGNTRIRLAFAGTGTNPVTYYACKERFANFGLRNCAVIGTGSYTITTLGDARVMTLSNPPAQAAPFTFTRTFVERGGRVYFSFQDKSTVTTAARLNTTAAKALLAQLGIPAVDPEVPLALTAASYQGTWNVRGTTKTTGGGLNLIVGANGINTCQDGDNFANVPCTFTISNPATGAFTANFTDGTGALTGTLNFITGVAAGTFTDTTSTPPSGNFAGARR